MELILGQNTVIPTKKTKVQIAVSNNKQALVDFSAYLLSHPTQKVRGDDDMVFFGQPSNAQKTVSLSATANGDTEFLMDLENIDPQIKKIAICVTLDDRSKTLQAIDGIAIKFKQGNKNIANTVLNGKNHSEAALIIAEFYRYRTDWKLRILGQGFNGGLKPLAEHFGVEVIDDESPQIQQHDIQITPPPPAIPHTPIIEAPSFSKMFKDVLSSPIKLLEKRKNQKLFTAMLKDALADNELSSTEMTQLRKFCAENSLVLDEALQQSKQDIDDFLRFILASIISDKEITEQTQRTITNLCNFLKPDQELQQEIDVTIQSLQQAQKIRNGDLKPIQAKGFVSRNTEIVWYQSEEVGNLDLNCADDEDGIAYTGRLIITSERVVFTSFNKPANIPLSSITGIEEELPLIYILAKTKKNSCIFVSDEESPIVFAHIEYALDCFHRKANIKSSSKGRTAIPQAVKNAAWIRDGGRCAECNSSGHIHFDHIIPVIKGGSNLLENIQVLCSTCNLKKGSKI